VTPAGRKGKTGSWVGDRAQSTVWQAASPKSIMSGSHEEKFALLIIERWQAFTGETAVRL
jgi:hypothetical protein